MGLTGVAWRLFFCALGAREGARSVKALPLRLFVVDVCRDHALPRSAYVPNVRKNTSSRANFAGRFVAIHVPATSAAVELAGSP